MKISWFNKHSPLALFKIFFVFFLLVSLVSRTMLLFLARDYLYLTPWEFLKIYGVGLYYDVVAFCYGSAPVALYVVVMPESWRRRPWQRFVIYPLSFFFLFGVLFSFTMEYYFWDEFNARFNWVAINYLIYTREIVGNFIESYPFIPGIVAILCLALGLLLLLRKRIADAFFGTSRFVQRFSFACLVVLIAAGDFFLNPVMVPPPISWNTYHNELACNGPYNFISAIHNYCFAFHDFYPTKNEAYVLQQLRKTISTQNSHFVSDQLHDITRRIDPLGPEKKLNVVVIVVESLSARYCGFFGNKEGLTPYLDSLAEDSVLFTRLYATGTRTVRGLEAVTLSIPPAPDVEAVRTHNTYFSIGDVFASKGYDLKFLYGGYSTFDNMQDFYTNHHFTIADQSHISKDDITFENIWGVCDEDLFALCLDECDRSYQSDKPFFEIVMTTSNHLPYTYPEGRIDIPPRTSREGAVKYTDYAIGKFIENAKERPWFDNTLFAIVADHCAVSSGTADISVWNYHIPFLVYSPKHIQPAKIDTLSSQIDVAPTILAMLNFHYDSRFFGKNILDMKPEDGRAIMGNNETIGLLKNDRLVILKPKKRIDTYALIPGQERLQPLPIDNDLVDLTITYFQALHALTEEK